MASLNSSVRAEYEAVPVDVADPPRTADSREPSTDHVTSSQQDYQDTVADAGASGGHSQQAATNMMTTTQWQRSEPSYDEYDRFAYKYHIVYDHIAGGMICVMLYVFISVFLGWGSGMGVMALGYRILRNEHVAGYDFRFSSTPVEIGENASPGFVLVYLLFCLFSNPLFESPSLLLSMLVLVCVVTLGGVVGGLVAGTWEELTRVFTFVETEERKEVIRMVVLKTALPAGAVGGIAFGAIAVFGPYFLIFVIRLGHPYYAYWKGQQVVECMLMDLERRDGT